MEEIEALKAKKAIEDREKAMSNVLNKNKEVLPVKNVVPSVNKIVNDKPNVVTEPSNVVVD